MTKRPIVREFIWKYDDDFDIWGWVMKGMPHFNAVRDAMTIHHDALEHLSYGTKFSDELQAFGSVLFFRYEGCFSWNRGPSKLYSLPAIIGDDLSSFLVDQMAMYGIADIAPITGRLVKSLYSTNDVIETAIQECLKTFHENYAKDWEDQLQNVTPEGAAELHRRVEHWMRVGYLRCARRWQGDAYHAALTAGRICTDVNRLTDRLSGYFGTDGAQGARLKVRYWPASGEHDVKVYFDGSNIANRW